MSGDIELEGHTRDAVYGFDGERYTICSCGERFDGVSIAEAIDFHEQHRARLEELLVAPLRKDAALRGLERSREALAETVARKQVAS